MVLKASWANLQLVDFNKAPFFEEALDFFKEKNFKSIYFFIDESKVGKYVLNKDLKKKSDMWEYLWKITKKYVEKKSKQLFEYEYAYEFYYKHLATNIALYYLLNKLKIEGDLKKFIIEKIIRKGWFSTPMPLTLRGFVSEECPHPIETLQTYYLALKWFLNDKTKHYYSEELLKEIEEYEDLIKDSIDPNWREKSKSLFRYRLRF